MAYWISHWKELNFLDHLYIMDLLYLKPKVNFFQKTWKLKSLQTSYFEVKLPIKENEKSFNFIGTFYNFSLLNPQGMIKPTKK